MTIQLQGIGKRNAIKANELVIGDIMICNYGYTQTFTKLEQIANDNIDEMRGSTGYIFKQEVEIKVLVGCTPDEQEEILAFHNKYAGMPSDSRNVYI